MPDERRIRRAAGKAPDAGATPDAPRTLREEQRELTRSKLIKAARQMFSEKNYVLATIDDIAERARVGRATFYFHFDSKEAVLMEILFQDLGRQDALFRRLARIADLDEDKLFDWVKQHLRGFEQNRSSVLLFNMMMGLDPAMITLFSRKREEQLAVLGETIPAFRFEGPDGPERKLEAHLLMFELSQLSFHLATTDWAVDRELAARVIARKFMAFIRGGAGT